MIGCLPNLDIQIAGHWRLHAEAYVTNPPHIVLRYNRGKIPLEDLLVADWRMTAILREAIAGETQANLVVASTMGGGKTTLCQALLGEVPVLDRIDTIEDTPELRLAAYGIHSNTYERLTRDANNERYRRTLDGGSHPRRQAEPTLGNWWWGRLEVRALWPCWTQ